MAQETTLSLCKRIYICAISLDLFKHVYSYFHLHSNIQYTFYNTMMIQKKAKRLIRTHSYVEFHLMSPIARQLQTFISAPAKKPKGARRNTLSPKNGSGVQKARDHNKESKENQLTSDKARKADSNKKGAVRRRTLSPQRPGHAQTSGLPKPAGRKDQNPASKVSRPASAKHDGLAHKSIARTLEERKTKSPPGKKGGKGGVQPPPQKPAVSPTLTSQEVPTQDVTKLLAGGGAPTPPLLNRNL